MDKNNQNACLMTTSIDENGKTILTYMPINVDISVIEFFLEHGTCTNNHAIAFELESTGDEFWEEMWKELEGSCE